MNPIGKPFIELSEVDSSNNYAMRQVQAQMAEHGCTWFAWDQTTGKGQRGKAWNSEAGKNIILSIVIQPSTLLDGNQFVLSMMAALSCYDFFSHYALDDTKIKWPNDIYWKDRKAGGILIENIIKDKKWRFSIVGIGININQTLFSSEVYNPVSLRQITGKEYDIIDLAKELCLCVERRWQQLEKNSPDVFLQEYCQHLYKRGEPVTFKKNNKVFTKTVDTVNMQGELIIDKETAAYGTIEWMR